MAPRKRLGEILIEAGLLDETGLRAALAEQRRWGGQLGRFLIEMQLVKEEMLVAALAKQLNFPTVDLDNTEIPQSAIDLIPADLAEQHSLIPMRKEGRFLDVAMSDPTNMGIIDEIRIRTQLNVRQYLVGPKAIDRALMKFYGKGFGAAAFNNRQGSQQSTGPEYGDGPMIELDDGLKTGADTSTLPSAPMGLTAESGAEIASLQARVSKLEGLVRRDEDVLRKVLALFIEKGLASREEILERIK